LYEKSIMIKAVISGDIVASTSLTGEGRELIEDSLQDLMEELGVKFNTFSRIIKGDYLECVVPDPENALLVAIAIKSFVKSIPVENTSLYKINKRVKLFKTYGIRLAIGYGTLSRFDTEKGIIDGEAIYLSGRKINKFSTYKKERIVIKNTMYFVSNDLYLNETFEPIIGLLDVLINKATSKQCKVLYLKLMNNNEHSIATLLGIKQSVVNQHSTSVGWNAIERTVMYFNALIKKQ
jgi:hypothetical protein